MKTEERPMELDALETLVAAGKYAILIQTDARKKE